MVERFLEEELGNPDGTGFETNLYSFALGHPKDFEPIKRAPAQECLVHLWQNAKKRGNLDYVVRELKRFMTNPFEKEFPERTVRNWLEGKWMPKDPARLLRVWYFLSCWGYEVEEMQKVPKIFRSLLEYIVFRKVEFPDVLDYLGLSGQKAFADLVIGGFDLDVPENRNILGKAFVLRLQLETREDDNLEDVEVDFIMLGRRDTVFIPRRNRS